jgi:hypothetical protein
MVHAAASRSPAWLRCLLHTSPSRRAMTAASLRRPRLLVTALTPVHLVLPAPIPVGVPTHVPTGREPPRTGPIRPLAVTGVREPAPRYPYIITHFHVLEVLELPLVLRMLMLGEEECFFTDVIVLAFGMLGRFSACGTSTTAT